MKISAVILAAGEGKRMGRPKAILEIGGIFLADIQYEFLGSLGIEGIKIVIGAEAERVRSLIKYSEYVVINEDYRYGQFSSLIKGISSLWGYDGLLVLPVDVYPLDRGVLKMLIVDFDPSFDAIVPEYNGRRGHPVILSFGFSKSLEKYDIRTSRLDYILRVSDVKTISVDSPTILNNVNQFSDILRSND